ncbi:DNA primase [Aurantivibrio plasticivorans]
MAGRIPQSFIDDVLDRVDIVELVDSRVKLKKSGKNYSACCPFHDEKTPSFTVTQDKQFYYCFGCGASGNAIGFLMEYERLNFPEAVEQLANLCGLEVPREERQQSAESIAREQARKSIYDLLERATDFYKYQLRAHPGKQRAVNYLQNRGLSGEIARDFGIGFAPPGWDNLLNALSNSNEEQSLLIESGMLVHREDNNKLYDRFRDRIMFPIRDVRGRTIGFGGRVLGDEKPKYLNSPESPVFHKGEELYGLYEARQSNSQLKRLLVVEGYMDVVALAQFGINYGVATLGTACRTDHLNKAFKYTQEIVFCFDGDAAGRNAARRALESALPVMTDGRQVKFLFLPEGEDPDTLVRQVGADKFTTMISHAIPLEEYFFDAVSEDLDPRSLEGKARLSKLAAPHLHQLPKGVYRELMFEHLAKRTGLDKTTLLEFIDEKPQPIANDEASGTSQTNDNVVAAEQDTLPDDYEHIANIGDHSSFETETQTQAPPHSRRRATSQIKLPPARLITLLLLHYPELASEVDECADLAEANDPHLALFLELLTLLKQRPHFTTGQILGHLQGTYGQERAQPISELSEQQGKLISSAKQSPNFDPKVEFLEVLSSIRRQRASLDAASIVADLGKRSFADLSEEDKQQLKQALADLKSPR